MVNLSKGLILVLIIGIILGLTLFAFYVYAVDTFSAISSVESPAPNGTEYYSTSPFLLNITTDQYADNCTFFLDANTTGQAMANWSTTRWYNNTIIPAFSSSPWNGVHNITFRCMMQAVDVWLNTSDTDDFVIFSINERAANTINVSLSIYGTNVVKWAQNGSEFYTMRPFVVNVSTNVTAASCTAYFNHTLQTAAMGNISGVRTNFANSSNINWGKNDYAWRNLTVVCVDAFGTKSWMNSSNSWGAGKFLLYKINERVGNSTWITEVSITNGTNASSAPKLNITLNQTASYCYWVANTSINAGVWTVMTNNSGGMTYFTNASNLDGGVLRDSLYGMFTNMTYRCTDAWQSAYTYFNFSGSNQAAINLTGRVMFRLDSTVPSISQSTDNTLHWILNTSQLTNVTQVNESIYFSSNSSWSTFAYPGPVQLELLNISNVTLQIGVANATYNSTHIQLWSNGTCAVPGTYTVTYTWRYYENVSTPVISGNYLNFTFVVSDTNKYKQGVYIFSPTGTKLEKIAEWVNESSIGTSATSIHTLAETYGVNLTGNELTKNGLYNISSWAMDINGKNSTTGVNISFLVTNLTASKWNLVVFNENATLKEIGSKVDGITYVSIFRNTLGWKNFTTFQTSLSTNGGVGINQSLNATLIYPSANRLLIRVASGPGTHNSTAWGVTWPSSNESLDTGGWNYVSARMRFALNESMFAGCYNRSVTVINETRSWASNASANLTTHPNIIAITNITNASWAIEGAGDELASDSVHNYTFNATAITLTDPPGAAGGKVGIMFGHNWLYTVTYTYSDGSYVYGNCANITYVSWYNTTTGKWCSARRGYTITSCSGLNAADIVLNKDTGFWILTSTNMTYNSTKVTGTGGW